MSRVLVTGHRGLIGRAVVTRLEDEGLEVRGFDLQDGDDVRDLGAVEGAARNCAFVVHLAALLGRDGDSAAEIADVNVLGTANVLRAAERGGARRVVFASSVDVLGVFKGEREPDHLPLDDDHPCRPTTAYGHSKLLGEALCRAFTARTGAASICLRPPGTLDDEIAEFLRRSRREDRDFEWTPFWEYGCVIHVLDLAAAVACALRCPDPGHVVLGVNAPDVSSAELTSRQLVAKLLPHVPWRGGSEFDRDPFRALMDTRRAEALLGWAPRVRWRASG